MAGDRGVHPQGDAALGRGHAPVRGPWPRPHGRRGAANEPVSATRYRVTEFRGPRGTYDVFAGGREPHERPDLWTFVEGRAREIFALYNYSEIRTPIFEEDRKSTRLNS